MVNAGYGNHRCLLGASYETREVHYGGSVESSEIVKNAVCGVTSVSEAAKKRSEIMSTFCRFIKIIDNLSVSSF